MRFAYTQDDGTVAIVNASPKKYIERDIGPLTDEEYRAHIIATSIPTGKTAIEVTEPLPDRSKRDKWKIKEGRVKLDE